MAAMAGVLIAIAFSLRGEDYLIPVLLGYMAAVIVWALVAESAAIRANRREAAPASDRPGSQPNTQTKPVPH
jgi:sigma54-dependent transcription regulator